MHVELSFLSAVAAAGAAFLIGNALTGRIPFLQHSFIPAPLIGGLIAAVVYLLLRGFGLVVEVPTEGYEVDFLIALLTTNMGLHITPRILKEGFKLFFVFVVAGASLALVQLSAAAIVVAWGDESLRSAIVAGPLSLVGAPFNLNPPSQTDPINGLFSAAFPDLESTAQGAMMLGVVAGIFVPGMFARHLFGKVDDKPPKSSPSDKDPRESLSQFGLEQTKLIVLILAIIATAFAVQQVLLNAFPAFMPDYLPVILISYLLGGTFRLIFETVSRRKKFPEKGLTVLLVGPTMGLVITYAVASVPLHLLFELPVRLMAGTVLAICFTVATARLLFPVLRRLTNDYYAATIATAFLAVTTGWGPLAMGYLRRFMGTEGPVEPMPVILPVNAFYLFPWMMIFLSRLFLGP